MYRCYACDSPAQLPCECTKVSSECNAVECSACVGNGVCANGAAQERVNIASGEDAVMMEECY